MDWLWDGDFLMAHFAQLDENNVVTQVIVIHNNELLDENNLESEQKGIDFCVNLFGGKWIQTSFNSNFRKNYAGIGYSYNSVLDAFIPIRPNESIGFDEDKCQWIVPEVNREYNEL